MAVLAPTLREDGILLRAVTPADVDDWLAGQDEEQVRWFEFPRWSTREDVVAAVQRWIAGWVNDGPVWQWGICDSATGMLAGGVELRDLGGHRFNLSYVVFPSFRRRGFATAAGRAVTAYAREHFNAESILIKVLEGNEPSLGVARNLGAVEVGTESSDAGGTFRVFRVPAPYRSTLDPGHLEQIRIWHDRAYAEELAAGSVDRTFEYLGTRIVVPPGVMPITPMSHLLGEQVRDRIGPGDRVLDMGTGSGVNAILAARSGAQVLAVDVSSPSLEAAFVNARANGVADRIEIRRSDVFSAVGEAFDWIVFDPPFRWFKPRSLTESVMADEDYRALTRFVAESRSHLTSDGRMLIFLGTSGDLGYLHHLLAEHGFRWEEVAHGEVDRDGWKVDYFTLLVK